MALFPFNNSLGIIRTMIRWSAWLLYWRSSPSYTTKSGTAVSQFLTSFVSWLVSSLNCRMQNELVVDFSLCTLWVVLVWTAFCTIAHDKYSLVFILLHQKSTISLQLWSFLVLLLWRRFFRPFIFTRNVGTSALYKPTVQVPINQLTVPIACFLVLETAVQSINDQFFLFDETGDLSVDSVGKSQKKENIREHRFRIGWIES